MNQLFLIAKFEGQQNPHGILTPEQFFSLDILWKWPCSAQSGGWGVQK